MTPKISICIPTYNGAVYLPQCLDSVISQSFSDFEILIVDDQSTDESLHIAQDYAIRDSRIRVIQNEKNLGLVGNWNHCIDLAQGEWIKFVFQDDLIRPTCLERMFEYCRSGDAIVACRREMLFEGVSDEIIAGYTRILNKSSIDGYFGGLSRIKPEQVCKAILDLKGENFIGEPTAVMFHRSAFERYGRFNLSLVQICDFEFNARVAVNTGLVYVPETLATFRVHPRGTSANNMDERRYRADELDTLILYHEFAYNPLFKPLQKIARKQVPAVSLKKMVAKRAFWTMNVARRALENPVNPNHSFMAQWETVASKFPILDKSFYLSIEKCHHFLDRNLLWRFSERQKSLGDL
jgi:glycosyltransferase involved in cell wall biosynthesis